MRTTRKACWPAKLRHPYDGEGRFALWHFSEDPSLDLFRPRVPGTNPGKQAMVWAVDTRHAPLFWFPRGCIWPVSATTAEDRERFFGQSAAGRIHVIESGWLRRMQTCRLYAYRLPAEPFRPHEVVGGYWITREPVEAAERVDMGDLLARHATPGSSCELRRLSGRSGGGSPPQPLSSVVRGCATPPLTLISSNNDLHGGGYLVKPIMNADLV